VTQKKCPALLGSLFTGQKDTASLIVIFAHQNCLHSLIPKPISSGRFSLRQVYGESLFSRHVILRPQVEESPSGQRSEKAFDFGAVHGIGIPLGVKEDKALTPVKGEGIMLEPKNIPNLIKEFFRGDF
jgi:hypothetical protein